MLEDGREPHRYPRTVPLLLARVHGAVSVTLRDADAADLDVLTTLMAEYYASEGFRFDEMYVRASHRGRGYGRAALAVIAATCGALGVRALHLEVARANVAARALYRKAGFEHHDRVLMTKWITP